jgi:hypothetical protein
MIELSVQSTRGAEQLRFQPSCLVIAGWTGRDAEVLEAHIRELEALGIARPRAVPIFYRVAAAQLTTTPTVEMVGQDASGEVEAVLFKHDGQLFVGVGSDHTDRKLETVGITLSKQLCAKPVGATVWRWAEVADHWDALMLRSTVNGGALYQQGSTTALRRPDELLALYERRHGPLPDGGVMFCGTLPAHGGIRFAAEMVLALEDPILGRRLEHRYGVTVLPIVEAIA